MFYAYSDFPAVSSWEPRNRRILDTGTAIHAQLQIYLAACAARSGGSEKFTKEVDINPDSNPVADALDLSGHTDGIYEIEDEDSIRVGVEIKSINDNGYKDLTRPHKEHVVQGTIYQKCLDLPVLIFLYYNKNDSSIAEYQQVFDPEVWAAIERKITYVRDMALAGKLPEQEVSRSCNNCKYKQICKPPRSAPKVSSSRTNPFRR